MSGFYFNYPALINLEFRYLINSLCPTLIEYTLKYFLSFFLNMYKMRFKLMHLVLITEEHSGFLGELDIFQKT